MFETLIPQYLNELPEGKVGYLASPQTFHAVKVQRLGRDKVKSSAKVCSKFEMPIFALVRNMPEQTDNLTETPPPIAGAFHFATQCLAECSEFFQGLLQKLWVLDFLTCRERQIGFHAEVGPNAFTCSGQDFLGCVICDNIEPIGADSITKDLDIAHSTFPLSVVMERKPAFIKLKGLRDFVPFFQRETDAPFFKKIPRLKLRRTITTFAFELWTNLQDLRFIKKPFPSEVQADNHCVKGVARYPRPMGVCPLEQLRQMWLQPITPRVFAIDAVIAVLKFEKVIMHITQVVKHVAKTHMLRMFAHLILIGTTMLFAFSFLFHG